MMLLLLLTGLVLSCETAPKPPEASSEVEQEVSSTVPDTAPSTVPEPAVPAVHVEKPAEASTETAGEPEFDPHSISEARFQAAKTDITAFINELNGIIRARNYNAWVAHLADSYFQEISSKPFLDERTEELYRRDQVIAQNMGRDPNMVEKRILRTARNYFDYVVVPSRANDRLDDIGFLSETRVRAYTIDGRGQRLILYDLAYINNKWLIVN